MKAVDDFFEDAWFQIEMHSRPATEQKAFTTTDPKNTMKGRRFAVIPAK